MPIFSTGLGQWDTPVVSFLLWSIDSISSDNGLPRQFWTFSTIISHYKSFRHIIEHYRAQNWHQLSLVRPTWGLQAVCIPGGCEGWPCNHNVRKLILIISQKRNSLYQGLRNAIKCILKIEKSNNWCIILFL